MLYSRLLEDLAPKPKVAGCPPIMLTLNTAGFTAAMDQAKAALDELAAAFENLNPGMSIDFEEDEDDPADWWRG